MTKKVDNGIIREMTSEEQAEYDNRMASFTPLSDFEISIIILREKRNSLLEKTDWWGTSDNTMTDSQKKYRQDLRDITNGLNTVEEVEAVEFPTKP